MASPNASTVLPSWDQLDFSRNCTAYGQWLSALITPDPWNPDSTLGSSVPLSLSLFTSALPPNWTMEVAANVSLGVQDLLQSSAGTAYFGLVMQWFTTNLYATYDAAEGLWLTEPAFVAHVVWEPARVCSTDFCRAIAFTGNADLSGIGVLITYYIEATLVTLYLFAFSIWRNHHIIQQRLRARAASRGNGRDGGDGDGQRRRWYRRLPRFLRAHDSLLHRSARAVFDAMRGSLFSINVCATVLALSVLIAAIVMECKHDTPLDRQNIPKGRSLYDSSLALLVGLFSVFPVAILIALAPTESDYATPPPPPPPPAPGSVSLPGGADSRTGHDGQDGQLSEDMGRRRGLHHGLLVVLWALMAALVFLDPRSELDYTFQGIVPDAGPVGPDALSVDEYAYVLYACDQRGGRAYWKTLHALKFLVLGLPMLWLVLTGLLYAVTARQDGRTPWLLKVFSRGKRAKEENREKKENKEIDENKKDKDNKESKDNDKSSRCSKCHKRHRSHGSHKSHGNQGSHMSHNTAPAAARTPQLLRLGWRQVVAWVNCGLMWAILGVLHDLRSKIIDAAGGLDNEDDWQFSQIIPIVGWCPVAADFMFSLLFGLEAGLDGHLPSDMSARMFDEEEEEEEEEMEEEEREEEGRTERKEDETEKEKEKGKADEKKKDKAKEGGHDKQQVSVVLDSGSDDTRTHSEAGGQHP